LTDPSLTENEKYQKIKMATEILESKASHEEKLLNAMGDGAALDRNVDKTIEVNDMYIESIKAKLMMLDHI